MPLRKLLPRDLTRYTQWDCVHFGEVSKSTRAKLDEAGLVVRILNGRTIHTERDMLESVGKALAFPGYYGKNWDALEECLRDMAWLRAKGYVLIISHSQELWTHALLAAGYLISSWLFAAQTWSQEQVAFHLVFDSSPSRETAA